MPTESDFQQILDDILAGNIAQDSTIQINIADGDVIGNDVTVASSEVNISGGEVGGEVEFFVRELNISGGNISATLRVQGSTNLFGSSFAINGDPLTSLAIQDGEVNFADIPAFIEILTDA